MKNRFTYNCLLEILMEISEDNKEFTDEDIVNEACTFLLAVIKIKDSLIGQVNA